MILQPEDFVAYFGKKKSCTVRQPGGSTNPTYTASKGPTLHGSTTAPPRVPGSGPRPSLHPTWQTIWGAKGSRKPILNHLQHCSISGNGVSFLFFLLGLFVLGSSWINTCWAARHQDTQLNHDPSSCITILQGQEVPGSGICSLHVFADSAPNREPCALLWVEPSGGPIWPLLTLRCSTYRSSHKRNHQNVDLER